MQTNPHQSERFYHMENINIDNAKRMMSEFSNTVKNNVATVAALASKVKWKTVSFTIPMNPKPAQRPRLCGHRVYVPGASKNGTFFQRNVLPKLGDLYITTPCRFVLDIYVKTPESFSKSQKLLAEMKILRPWTSTGDVDNYSKAVMDCMMPNEKRGHQGILYDDSLVIELHATKYYSISPRYEVKISYMSNVPDDLMKILRIKNLE